jgi:hypothetical protein
MENTATFYGISLNFDKSIPYHPTKVKIQAYGDTNIDEIINIDDYTVDAEILFENVQGIYIEFLETPINTRYRLSSIDFGLTKEFKLNEIISSKETRAVDPISSILPRNEFRFEIINKDHIYDIDNPQGVYRFIENKKNPVKYYYGYELDDGSIEWVKGGEVLNTGEMRTDVSNNSSTVTFVTLDYINYMDDIYYYGKYENKTFYDLAVAVFENSELPLLEDGSPRYYIHDSLKNYSTNVPLPVTEGKNLLQMIANACMCSLYVDRDGIIRIEPIYSSNKEDFYLNYDKTFSSPTLIKKYPLTYAIHSTLSRVAPKSEEELLYETQIDYSEIPYEGYITLKLEYEASTDHRVVIPTDYDGVTRGEVISANFYARYAEIKVSGTYSFTVKLYGKPLRYSSRVIEVNENTSGEIVKIDNELINDLNHLYSYMSWIARYVKMQNKYQVSYVGNPEVDAGRYIEAQTRFITRASAILVEHTIDYNGALSGEATFFLENYR